MEFVTCSLLIIQVAWTTRFGHGIYVKVDNYNNTISNHKSSRWGIVQLATGLLLGECSYYV